MLKKSILLYLIILSSWAYAQNVIKGALTDEYGSPVGGASVSLISPKDGEVIAYTFSDKNGKYLIKNSAALEELYIIVKSMNFAEEKLKIKNLTQTKDFKLSGKIIQLKEVVAKSHPIRRRGDTISYSVKSFAQAQDRNLQDILKRLPGIEVEKSGRVLYQGEPINKFYIEGLDLLGGKYNIANKNLPHKEVESVQVIENHQPIKALDSLVFSNKAALNIKLKNKYTQTGSAELGVGASPMLWLANVTPMLFSQKRQYLLSYQATNTGENLQRQTTELISDREKEDNTTDAEIYYLALPQASPPSVSSVFWNDNNAHIASLNYIQKLKNDYTIRLNNSYYNDFHKIIGESRTTYFNNGANLKIYESTKNRVFSNELQHNLEITKNKKSYYFNNQLNFRTSWRGEDVLLQSERGEFNQSLGSKNSNFSNNLSLMLPIGRQIYSIKSDISYTRTPQNLDIQLDFFENLFPQSLGKNIEQAVELSQFYTNNHLGFTKTWKKISFSHKIGFTLDNNQLNTGIYTQSQEQLPSDFYNHLRLNNSLFYIKSKIETRLNARWQIGLSLPITQQLIRWKDTPLNLDRQKNTTRLEPYFYTLYKLNSFWTFSGDLWWKQSLGDVRNLYHAYILKNYRKIDRTPSILPEAHSFNYELKVEYRNPLESIFAFVKYKHSQSDKNLLFSTRLKDNGATEIEATEQKNTSENQSLTIRINKYFGDIKTNAALTGLWSAAKSEQVFNGERGWGETQNWLAKGKIQTEFFSKFKTQYTATLSHTRPTWHGVAQKPITTQAHSLELIYYPTKKHGFIHQTEWIKNSLFSGKQTYLFSSLKYLFSLQKNQIDLELSWNNIFNIKEYRTLHSSTLSTAENIYQLRPSQFLAKIRFNL
ncbi:hypothetical protein EQP59_00750 [Ornithobacterium rhinotracheale]|uniref:Carboxypeptidase regulatory-like domain-containing protein n=1 Tax=Ornithobacterium rhinotracheale TaxID=28251 RepID=A0A410JPF1_ORNRH|nr:carboxypeptidase-like regulatory domain-containing protein [Ornithobacterium rhinotracheale]QAR29991.1 hypothetical protein EQP59_00750 [Ornithobacterium rhinotracheale]